MQGVLTAGVRLELSELAEGMVCPGTDDGKREWILRKGPDTITCYKYLPYLIHVELLLFLWELARQTILGERSYDA